MSRRLALVALSLALIAGVLSACTQPAGIPPAEPGPTAAPLFASDDEALEAATAAYAEFLRVSGEILRDGGADPERLRPLVSDEVYETEAEGFARFAALQYRALGESSITESSLQQWYVVSSSEVEIIAYFCVSLDGTDVIDSEGLSVVSPDRPVASTFEIVLRGSGVDFVLEQKEIWHGDSVCA